LAENQLSSKSSLAVFEKIQEIMIKEMGEKSQES
jgi:hypothetical protein